MIDKKYKLVIVTPAGRKKYMEILLKYILKQKNIIDEYRIWVNTTNEDDLIWFNEIGNKYKELVKLEYLPQDVNVDGNRSIYKFFENCIEEDTIYLRFDDDIVWMEDDFIEKIVKFRIENPRYFLIFGNIINNAVIDHVHQNNGVLYSCKIKNDCLCSNGWGNPVLAEEKHRTFLKNLNNGNINMYRFETLESVKRISINCICWFGKEFKRFNGIVSREIGEEHWLSEVKPSVIRKKNCVFGNAICSHYSFWVQREYLDNTDILEKYAEIARNIRI